MEIIIWIIFGGLVGWIASIIMKTNQQQGIMLNIIVGIIGALKKLSAIQFNLFKVIGELLIAKSVKP